MIISSSLPRKIGCERVYSTLDFSQFTMYVFFFTRLAFQSHDEIHWRQISIPNHGVYGSFSKRHSSFRRFNSLVILLSTTRQSKTSFKQRVSNKKSAMKAYNFVHSLFILLKFFLFTPFLFVGGFNGFGSKSRLETVLHYHRC